MSLEGLRELRRRGLRPATPVIVVVGHQPAWVDDDPGHIVLTARSRPAQMDFRPLVGLWVAVLMNEPLWTVAGPLVDVIEEAKAKLFGWVLPDGRVHLGVLDPQPDDFNNLRLTWELYQ